MPIVLTVLVIMFITMMVDDILEINIWTYGINKFRNRIKVTDISEVNINKCRCGTKPKVKWACNNTTVIKNLDRENAFDYAVEIKCPKCGFCLYENNIFVFEANGASFKYIPNPREINNTNLKLVKKWNEINPKKCEEC